eukprot:798004-Prymnesium_polylepis.1
MVVDDCSEVARGARELRSKMVYKYKTNNTKQSHLATLQSTSRGARPRLTVLVQYIARVPD